MEAQNHHADNVEKTIPRFGKIGHHRPVQIAYRGMISLNRMTRCLGHYGGRILSPLYMDFLAPLEGEQMKEQKNKDERPCLQHRP